MVHWDNVRELSHTEPGTCHSFVQHNWLNTYLLYGDTQIGIKDTAVIKQLVPIFKETTAWCT